MSALDVLFASAAGRWVRASENAGCEELSFESRLSGDGDIWENGKWRDARPDDEAILPGREFDRVTYDLSDWDGISLEFVGYVGEPPTEEEQERIWALGFTVIRIDYAKDDPRKRNSISGDWWREKGHPEGCCSCKHRLGEPHRPLKRSEATPAETPSSSPPREAPHDGPEGGG